MSEPTKHGNTPAHGDFERQDISAASIIYFLVGLVAATLLIHFVLAGLYDILDKRARVNEPSPNPLVTNIPEDTRKVTPGFPARVFPDPRLETDERTQLNAVRIAEEQRLNSYGWVDEKTGTVHIPIERAMDLMAQRGLPTYSSNAADQPQAKKEGAKRESSAKEKKEPKGKRT